MSNLINIILCGGAGTRLWPLSNAQQPKQLLQLFEGKSLLQLTALRNCSFAKKVVAVSSTSIAGRVRSQLQERISSCNLTIIEEPAARNTAAAIALAACITAPSDILLVTPSDHLVGKPDIYEHAVTQAVELAESNYLVTFGLSPLYPETGYGYMQYSGNDVIRFTEKPSLLLARNFVAAGDYVWNSGIFCFKAAILLSELRSYAPEIYEQALIAANEWKENNGKISLETMNNIPSSSIDYAVMEKSQRVKVIPVQMDWSDVGSYEALSEALLQQYQHKNKAAVYIESNASENTVIGDEKLVALVGVEDLVIVNSENAILIMKKGYGQHIKSLHQWVKENRPELQ